MSQIEKDIHQWSKDALAHWLDDSMMRYEVGGVSGRQAFSNLVSDLWHLSASMLVELSSVSPRVAGGRYALLMIAIKKDEQENAQDRDVSKP